MTGLLTKRRRGRPRVLSRAVLALAVVLLVPAFVAGATPGITEPASFLVVPGESAPVLAHLTWAPALSDSGSVRYTISVASAPDGPWAHAGETPSTSYEYSGGFSGHPYYFRIAARDAGGRQSDYVIGGPVTAEWKSSPHVNKSSSTDVCGTCHSSHGGTSPSLLREGIAEQAGGQAGLCLSCHDGLGAASDVKAGDVDSFGLPSGHSIEGSAAAVADPTKECSSCHDPHLLSGSGSAFAREINGTTVTSAGPGWCYACHAVSRDWFGPGYPETTPSVNASGYPVAGTWPGPDTYASTANAHRLIPETTQTPESGIAVRRSQGDCLYCHGAHGGSNEYDGLRAAFRPPAASTLETDQAQGEYASLCFGCHGGVTPSGFETRPADIKQFVTSGSAWAGHRVETSGGVLPVGAPLPCYECHGPHGSKRGNASLLSDALGTGLETATDAGVRHFCFACHTASDSGRGWDSQEATFTAVADSDHVVGIPRTGGVLRLPPLAAHAELSATSCYACHGSDYGAPSGNNVHNPAGGGYDPGLHTAAPPPESYTIAGSTYGPIACDTCHAVELGPEHFKASSSSAARGCESCHPSPRDSLLPWGKTCGEAGCHGTGSTSEKHLRIETSHVVPSTQCTVSGCHAEPSVASIHSSATTTTPEGTYSGCAVCHRPQVSLTTDCGSCHEGGGDLHAGADHVGEAGGVAIPPLDDGETHMSVGDKAFVVCSDCHTTDLLALHVRDCGACHAETAAPAVRAAVQSEDTGCDACHNPWQHEDISPGVHAPIYESGSCDCHLEDPYQYYDRITCTVSGCHPPATPVPSPVTTTDARPNYVGDAIVTLSANDGVPGTIGIRATYYRLDGDASKPGTSVVVPAPASGEAAEQHNLEYWSTDWSGHTESPKQVTFTVAPGDATVTLDYWAGTGGSISGPAHQTIPMGGSGVPVTAVASTGFRFAVWSDGGTSATRSDTNVTQDMSITAEFQPAPTFVLTTTAGPGGRVEPSGSTTVTQGASQTCTITPDFGFHVAQVQVDGVDQGALTSYTFENVTANHVLAVTFAPDVHTLTYSGGTGGFVTGTSPQYVTHGGAGTSVTAVANTGYHFTAWSDGVTSASRLDDEVVGDLSVTADFAPNTYVLTYRASSGGAISGAADQTVEHGRDGTPVTAVADAGYRFVGWSDGVSTETRTDRSVIEDVDVTASFVAEPHTVTYSAGPGGVILGESVQYVADGGSGTSVTAVAQTGYHFVRWSDGGVSASRFEENVRADVSVTAEFERNVYTLTYRAGDGGTISGQAIQSVAHGDSGSAVTAVASDGYHFLQWSDGLLTAARSESAVAGDLDVTAQFEADGAQTEFTYSATGALQTFIVPDGVAVLDVELYGAQGGGDGAETAGGLGGAVHALLPVTSGQLLNIKVGTSGDNGGWPNGGGGSPWGGGGGGSSSILVGTAVLMEAGGGGGSVYGMGGGAGGSYPATDPGGNGIGGSSDYGAGGGGGWNGGGVAGDDQPGDGGTSRIATGNGTMTAGVRAGDGLVVIRLAQ